jgi:hypothetical protein
VPVVFDVGDPDDSFKLKHFDAVGEGGPDCCGGQTASPIVLEKPVSKINLSHVVQKL